jgi:hypothetical protein
MVMTQEVINLYQKYRQATFDKMNFGKIGNDLQAEAPCNPELI